MALARDALSSGNPVSAENYFQHAEHYNRIIQAAQAKQEEQAAAQSSRAESSRAEPPKQARSHDRRPPRQRNENAEATPLNVEPAVPGSGEQPSVNGNGADSEPTPEKPKRKPRARKPKVEKAESAEEKKPKGEDNTIVA